MSRGQQSTGASIIELAVVCLGLFVLVAAELFVTGTRVVFYHPLWLDECLTQLLATDPSFTHSMAAIRGGVETNPPTLYLVLWPLARLTGGGDVVFLRAFAATSMILALVGVYAICRRFFDRGPSIIGTLVLAAHPIVIGQMFEARFYGPWLALTTWFAYFTLIESRDRVGLTIIRCMLAMLLATIHWFGVISLGLIVLTDLVLHREPLKPRVIRALPLLCGIVALLACAPFYFGQRQGLSVSTWLEPVTPRNIAGIAKHIMFVPSMLALVVYAGWRWIGKTASDSARLPRRELVRRLAPLASLLLFPVIVVVFSLLVQPALLDRYVIVAVAPLGLLVAALAAPMNRRADRWLGAAVIAGLLIAAGYELRRVKSSIDIVDGQNAQAFVIVNDTVARHGPTPVAFYQRREYYPVIHMDSGLIEAVALLDFDSVPDPAITPRTLFERDMGRRVNRFYERYRLINIDQLRRMPKFIVIAPPYDESEMMVLLKDFKVTHAGPEMYEATLR